MPANLTIDGRTSDIPPATVTAYQLARYEVFASPAFDQFIGKRSPALARLMAAHGAQTAATITAWNPFSQPATDRENAAAQAMLVEQVRLGGWHDIEAFGHDPSGTWPGEPNLSVLAIDAPALFALGRRFRQNAVTLAGVDAVPQLCLLR